MGWAMTNLSALVMDFKDPNIASELIQQPISQAEFNFLCETHLLKNEDEIDRTEFIICCCLRLKAMTPAIVSAVSEQFSLLDTDGSGALSFEEMGIAVKDNGFHVQNFIARRLTSMHTKYAAPDAVNSSPLAIPEAS